MKKATSLFAALFCLVCLTGATWLPLFHQASAAYVGPGDLALSGSFAMWNGFSCFKASAPTAKAVRLINETTTTQADINCNTTTGIDLSAVSSLGCGSAVCKLVTIYDQTGALDCGGAACDLTQSTDANRPTYAASGGAGGKPCATWGASVLLATGAGISSGAQPFSIYAVAERNPTSSSLQGLFSSSGTFVGMYFAAASNAVTIFDGGFGANVTATDAAFHDIQAIFNGASSVMNVDGTSTGTTASAGGPFGSVGGVILGSNSGDLIGAACEVGLVDVALTSVDQTALNSNIHTRYGF